MAVSGNLHLQGGAGGEAGGGNSGAAASAPAPLRTSQLNKYSRYHRTFRLRLRSRRRAGRYDTMMCGADSSTASVAMIVNRVKIIRHSLSTTMAANFQSREMSASSSSLRICKYGTHLVKKMLTHMIHSSKLSIKTCLIKVRRVKNYLICNDSDLFKYKRQLVVHTETAVRSQPSTVLLAPPATGTAL